MVLFGGAAYNQNSNLLGSILEPPDWKLWGLDFKKCWVADKRSKLFFNECRRWKVPTSRSNLNLDKTSISSKAPSQAAGVGRLHDTSVRRGKCWMCISHSVFWRTPLYMNLCLQLGSGAIGGKATVSRNTEML